jgi:putative transposase
MILTYKIRHGQNFTAELRKAKIVAKFGVANRDKLSSKYVKAIGLKATIASQILWKYGRNKKCKAISRVNLIVPGQGVKRTGGELKISCLKLALTLQKPFEKVNQIELDKEFAYISVTVKDQPEFKEKVTIGIDRNTTGHIAVAAVLETGKVYKLGKSALHIRNKYKHIRKDLQSKGKFKKLVTIKRRESNIIRDLNHKISRTLVNLATRLKGRLVLENLEGIRGRAKSSHSFRFALNSWSFYQLQTFLEYKAKLAGVPISYIDPYHTSKCCSRCGLVGNRAGKSFKCPSCGHVEHADTNAAFNIANVAKNVFNFRDKEFAEKGALIPHNELCLASNSRTPSL